MKALKAIGKILALLLFVGIAYSAIPWAAFFGPTSAYTLYCDEGMKTTTECGGKWKPNAEILFYASPETQVVVLKHGILPPEKLENCAVLDGTNWHCNTSHGTFSMENGQLHNWARDRTLLMRPVMKPVWVFYKYREEAFF